MTPQPDPMTPPAALTPDQLAELRRLYRNWCMGGIHSERQERRRLLEDAVWHALPALLDAADELAETEAALTVALRIATERALENDRLRAEVAALQQQVQGHAERIAAQSELLSRRAEKQP